jgi:hypothetical protein
MQDDLLQSSFIDVVVQGSFGLAEEERQFVPVFEHISDGLANA